MQFSKRWSYHSFWYNDIGKSSWDKNFRHWSFIIFNHTSTLYCFLKDLFAYLAGGIGGVHRGGESTLDISADLQELSRTPVAVVSSGVKSILDIPRTLEVLETLGVPVISYKTNKFTAFFTEDSGCIAPMVVSSPEEAAHLLSKSTLLGLTSGMLIAVPPPVSLDSSIIEDVIVKALHSASLENIRGPAITPYLLAAVQRLMGDAAIDTNIALIKNNAKVAADIAIAYSKLESKNIIHHNRHNPAISPQRLTTAKHSFVDLTTIGRTPDGSVLHSTHSAVKGLHRSDDGRGTQQCLKTSTSNVVLIGAATVDYIASPHPPPATPLIQGSSIPGKMKTCFGGVARNIAENLVRLDVSGVSLCTVVGEDAAGSAVCRDASKLNIDISQVIISSTTSTATYTAIHHQGGELSAAIADMDAVTQITPAAVHSFLDRHVIPPSASSQDPSHPHTNVSHNHSPAVRHAIVISDGNISLEAFSALAGRCGAESLPLLFEPTSDVKCLLPIHAESLHLVLFYSFLNICCMLRFDLI